MRRYLVRRARGDGKTRGRRPRKASPPLSRLSDLLRLGADSGDFVSGQRAWVVLVTDVVSLFLLGLLVLQGLFRPEPYSTASSAVLYLLVCGAVLSLVVLKVLGHRAASHVTVAAAMLGVWFLNVWFAFQPGIKTDTVYLVAMSVLPALLLGGLWTGVYAVGTLLVVFYVASAMGRTGTGTAAVMDYLVDTSAAVLFVVFLTVIISDIYTRALDRVRRLLDRQKRQNAELIRMAHLVEQSEAQKRQFYRETIHSITDGKLSICDSSEIRPLLASAELELTVPDAASVSSVRGETKGYLARQGLEGGELESFIVAAGEAITNLVKHADGGRVYSGTADDSVWVACEDRGSGIESLTLPKAVLLRGFSTKPSLGLGYSVILEIADRVLLKTDESGTIVVLFKRLHPVPLDVSVGHLPDTWG